MLGDVAAFSCLDGETVPHFDRKLVSPSTHGRVQVAYSSRESRF